MTDSTSMYMFMETPQHLQSKQSSSVGYMYVVYKRYYEYLGSFYRGSIDYILTLQLKPSGEEILEQLRLIKICCFKPLSRAKMSLHIHYSVNLLQGAWMQNSLKRKNERRSQILTGHGSGCIKKMFEVHWINRIDNYSISLRCWFACTVLT